MAKTRLGLVGERRSIPNTKWPVCLEPVTENRPVFRIFSVRHSFLCYYSTRTSLSLLIGSS